MTQQTQLQQLNDKVGNAAAGLGIPREWVNDPSRGLATMDRFRQQHNDPRYYPAAQQQPISERVTDHKSLVATSSTVQGTVDTETTPTETLT